MRERAYVLVTLHRPSNVDDPARLAAIVEGLVGLAAHAPVVFPIHPRTRARLAEDGALGRLEAAGVSCIEPLAYLEFLSLQAGAGAIVTDSGGVQEEASALGVVVLHVPPEHRAADHAHPRHEHAAGRRPAEISEVRPASHPPTPCAIPLWDGHAGERVADALVANYAMMPGVAGSCA